MSSRIPPEKNVGTATAPWYPAGKSTKSPQAKSSANRPSRTPTTTPRAKTSLSPSDSSRPGAYGQLKSSGDANLKRKLSVEASPEKRRHPGVKLLDGDDLISTAVEARQAVNKAAVGAYHTFVAARKRTFR
jgi:hypothetical protein